MHFYSHAEFMNAVLARAPISPIFAPNSVICTASYEFAATDRTPLGFAPRVLQIIPITNIISLYTFANPWVYEITFDEKTRKYRRRESVVNTFEDYNNEFVTIEFINIIGHLYKVILTN